MASSIIRDERRGTSDAKSGVVADGTSDGAVVANTGALVEDHASLAVETISCVTDGTS